MQKAAKCGEITRLVAQERVRKHLGARVNIFIHGEFAFALSGELVFKYGLHPGVRLDEQHVARLLLEDGEQKALNTARNFIGFRPRSREEIRKRLQKDEWDEKVIESVVERLETAGLINDAQFSQLWVENRGLSRPRGAFLLRAELQQKGVEKETILDSLPDAEKEMQNALFLLQKSSRKLEKFNGRELEQKAIGLLTRRGFRFDTAKTALKKWQEEPR